MYKQKFSYFTRSISIFRCQRAKNLYNALEINQNATQTEIKEAYYKLSMRYHPDKSSSEETSQKFRDITEAYEVLRNVRLRKLYDKGLFLRTSVPIQENDVDMFQKSRQYRSKAPTYTGKTPIYDFDEWSKSHYGATLARDLERKKRRTQERSTKQTEIEDVKTTNVLVCGLVLLLFAAFLFYQGEDYDEIKTPNGRK